MKPQRKLFGIPLTICIFSFTLFTIFFFSNTPIWAQGKDKEKVTFMEVPQPPLENLEKAVAKQLREGRNMVDAVVSSKKVDDKRRGNAYGELGLLYHAYELNDAAEACYRNAVLLLPEHFEWNYNLANLLQGIGKFNEALQFYKKLEPEKLENQQAYLVHIRIGECYRSLNQPDLANEAFRAAYKINPDGPAALARLGEIALGEKKFDDAVKYLATALDKQPAANQLHYPLAMAYRGAGQMDLARQHIAKRGMVGVQPPDPLKIKLKNLVQGYRVHLLAGRLAYSAGRFVEAEESFRKAIEASPNEVAARINLAVTLIQQKKVEEAFQQLNKSIELKPDNITAHFNLGTMYTFYGKYEQGIQHLKVVVAKKPEDAVAHFNLADAYRKNRQYDEAVKYYESTVKLNPALSEGWLHLNYLLTSQKQYDRAMKSIEEAHQRIPNDLSITHALARQLAVSPKLSKRNGKRAYELAKKVYDKTKYFDCARTVAMACAELNKCDDAVTWMEIAIKLADQSGQPEELLQKLRLNLNHFKTHRPCRVPGS